MDIRFTKGDDRDLKFTLQKVVSYAVLRMESEHDVNIRRNIFQEYKEARTFY